MRRQTFPGFRIRDGLLNLLCLALAGFFLATGLGKVIGYSEMVGDFARWGYPEWLVILASSLEITGAILLLAPRLATTGAILVSISMLGAFATHALNGQPAKAVLTASLLLVLLFVAVARLPRSIWLSEKLKPASS